MTKQAPVFQSFRIFRSEIYEAYIHMPKYAQFNIGAIVRSLNAYLGLFRSMPQMRAFNLRKAVCLAALPLISEWCYVKDCEKFVVKRNIRNKKLAEMRNRITDHQF